MSRLYVSPAHPLRRPRACSCACSSRRRRRNRQARCSRARRRRADAGRSSGMPRSVQLTRARSTPLGFAPADPDTARVSRPSCQSPNPSSASHRASPAPISQRPYLPISGLSQTSTDDGIRTRIPTLYRRARTSGRQQRLSTQSMQQVHCAVVAPASDRDCRIGQPLAWFPSCT
ncbi:hypothetical protein GY45DRAFT_124345 [Cubamyces sp. BRFM 1775]|nr:hypothetical protein GY45DRAFT_124345 [Cubamyces sp. BRFM 1775]